MIKVNNLSFSFPQKDLYQEISFTLEEGQHCAFIGTSGSGKSTLLHLLMDPDRFTYDGLLQMSDQVKIGYASQFSQVDPTQCQTVSSYVGEAYLQLQEKITAICTEMETATELDSLMEAYQLSMDAFDALGGDDFETRRDRQLSLAGLYQHRDLPVASLSGGEFKLVQVMREMLLRPDLLIMDEPDAYLDFENLHALKALMNAHKGALLVITHNRYLLNHCFDKILHLENQELQEYNGNYIDYNFSLLQTKIETQELQIADDEEIERNEVLIEKFRKTATITNEESAGRKLKARVKVQNRLLERRIKAPFVSIRQPDIRLQPDVQIGQQASEIIDSAASEGVALAIHDYNVAFDMTLFNHANFEMGATDKVALIGGNGTGKSTLLRDIYRNNHASIVIRSDMKVAYLSQQQDETLDGKNTIMDEFFEAGFKTRQAILEHVVPYGFEEDILEQQIASLSGGEKSMLQLAKISAGGSNLLLLDEPTSHLDTYSQIALENALNHYKGAILMVSHDFYTISNCMDYVLLIEDQSIRRMSLRKFRQMIYAHHYDKDYIEIEQKKKAIETKIELALMEKDYVLAKALVEALEPLISQLLFMNQ